jgi:hypothetical protein
MAVLPTHHQRGIAGGVPYSGRKTFRLKEKYIIVLILITFGTVLYGAFFFLPDKIDRVEIVRELLKENGGNMFIPRPDVREIKADFKHRDSKDRDKDRIDKDRELIQAKVDEAKKAKEEREKADAEQKAILEKIRMKLNATQVIQQNLSNFISGMQPNQNRTPIMKGARDHYGYPGGEPGAGEPKDAAVKEKRDKVREVRSI